MAVGFGKYQLLRKIGSGGMGQVFLARQEAAQGFEKLVVIKRILPHLVEDEEFLAMFFDEARIAARLNHPNLVQIFDLGEVHGAHFLAMEYVQGEDLRKLDRFARANGALIPLPALLRIVADAAAGLDYAHKARDAQGKPLHLVHRDVSPQNILVGFDGAVKLIDFGVVKAAGRVQHTGTGVLKGKYPYMSPEQAEGRELDARSDIFALGVVAWEVLTGKRLFKAESDLATMRLVVDCQVPAPSRLNPTLPASLDPVILKALQRDANDRYPDAAAFRLAIEDLILAERLPASSAHLASYLGGLYRDRIAHEADPSHLDELSDAEDPDGDSYPSGSTPGSRQNWRQGRPPSRPAIAAVRARSRSDAQAARRTPVPPVFVDDEPTHDASGDAAADTEEREATRSAPTRGTASLRDPGGRSLPRWAVGAIIAGMVLVTAGLGVVVVRTELRQQPPATQPAPVSTAPEAIAPSQPATTAPQQVVVKLISEPAGATVEVDGEAVGKTPLEYTLSGDAAVEAQLTLAGYEPRTATLAAAGEPEVVVKLARKRAPTRRPSSLGIKTDR